MASSIFALPVLIWSSGQTPASSTHATSSSRKRKRGQVLSDLRDNVGDSDEETVGPSSSQTTQSGNESGRKPPILTPDEIHQYSVAGQPLDQDRPGHHFPHSAGRKQTTIPPGENLDRHAPRGLAATKTATLRQQHLAVITAILHRCILKRDFERASRALGLILRDEIGGQTVDLRTHGRWGIGAEILLRKGQRAPGDQSSRRESPMISRPGFELAKRYYERLIVQYSYHRASKDAFDERDFHLALMGLWIYVAHEEGKMIRQGNPETDEDRERDYEAGTQRELTEARSIAKRLDRLLNSPLYSSHDEFIRLRAMVALWIADLAQDIDHSDRESRIQSQSSEIETSLAESVFGVVLDDPDGLDHDRTSGNRDKMDRNIEVEESRRKAEELFALLRHRLEDGIHD